MPSNLIKIYIAGKIAGDPNYKEKFAAVQKHYEEKGFAVINPAALPSNMRPCDYMRICFAMIDTADIVIFLPDYEKSAGARLEMQYCLYTDKTFKVKESEVQI